MIVGVLLLLSGILMVTTVFPDFDIVSIADDLAFGLATCVAITFGGLRWIGRRWPKPCLPEDFSRALAETDRSTWRMPPLTLLEPVQWSAGTRLGMLALRGYLIVGAILLVVKAVQLGSA
ncbi:putative membrane protein [Mycobacterium xenopi 3993]|nr:putative membrane protein [Mycobacterium xenopi 3993]